MGHRSHISTTYLILIAATVIIFVTYLGYKHLICASNCASASAYLPFLYIPLGLLFYFGIKKISDTVSSRTGITLWYEPKTHEHNQIDAVKILDAYMEAESRLASHRVAVHINEITGVLEHKYPKTPPKVLEQETIKGLLVNTKNNELFILGGLVCGYSDYITSALASRSVYNNAIMGNNYQFANNAEKILKINNIIPIDHLNFLSFRNIIPHKNYSNLVINVPDNGFLSDVEGRMHLTGVFNSYCLLMRLCGIIGVEVVGSC
jgi:hypothetical protein